MHARQQLRAGIGSLAAQHMDTMPIAPRGQSGISCQFYRSRPARPATHSASTKARRLLAEALAIRARRIRPMPAASFSAAMATKAFFWLPRPRGPFSQAADVSLIDLDLARKPIQAPNAPWPGAACATNSTRCCSCKSPNTRCRPKALAPFFTAGHMPHGAKPQPQRLASVLEKSCRRSRWSDGESLCRQSAHGLWAKLRAHRSAGRQNPRANAAL